jgi:hypothetical protein
VRIIEKYLINGKRWHMIQLENGEKFFPDDISAIHVSRGQSILNRLREGANTAPYEFEQEGILNGYNDGYIIIRPVKEAEMNEFGEVSP